MLDGLGLLALLAVLLGGDFSSGVRGMRSERPPRADFLRHALHRVREAMMAPPSRIDAERGTVSLEGDWLVPRG